VARVLAIGEPAPFKQIHLATDATARYPCSSVDNERKIANADRALYHQLQQGKAKREKLGHALKFERWQLSTEAMRQKAALLAQCDQAITFAAKELASTLPDSAAKLKGLEDALAMLEQCDEDQQ
jgi:hypothetical protein